jgi:LmbE family N-acetylglucosaminyl deacetylase
VEQQSGGSFGASRFLDGAMSSHVDIRSFRNGYFPYVAADIKDYFESLKDGLDPDIVLTHFREDRHQDHRTISDLTWNTFRNHMILEYEIPKFDGDLCTPNFYVPVNEEDADFKVTAIMDCFATQAPKEWFDERTFFALMRLRGVECIAQSGLAEAFYVRKAVFDSK